VKAGSKNPASPDVVKTDQKESDTEERQGCEIGRIGHDMMAVKGPVEDIHAIGQGKNVA